MTDHVKNTCRPGAGSSCCRYLVAGPQGFECAKHTVHKQTLDFRVAQGTMNAQGDNCPGFFPNESIEKLNGNKDGNTEAEGD